MSNKLVVSKTISLKEGWNEQDLLEFGVNTLRTQKAVSALVDDPNLILESINQSIELVLLQREVDNSESLDTSFWVDVATGKISD